MASTFDFYARLMTPGAAAEYAALGFWCDEPQCRAAATVFAAFREQEARTVRIHERFYCEAHGTEFAGRHNITIEPAPDEAP